MAETDMDKATGAEGGDGQEGTVEGTDGVQGTDFAAEAAKWKALARKHEAQAKANAAAAKKLQEIEDSKKSDIEKAQSAAQAAEKRAEAAEARALRYEIALEKGVPQKLMRFLAGSTREEIEAAADELLDAIKPADTGGDKNAGGKPKESLAPGASSAGTADEDKPLSEVLAAIPRAS